MGNGKPFLRMGMTISFPVVADVKARREVRSASVVQARDENLNSVE